MTYIKNISFILTLLFLIGFLMQSCAPSGKVHYGVNIHHRSGWGHPYYRHKYYHHRPTVHFHIRSGHRGLGRR